MIIFPSIIVLLLSSQSIAVRTYTCPKLFLPSSQLIALTYFFFHCKFFTLPYLFLSSSLSGKRLQLYFTSPYCCRLCRGLIIPNQVWNLGLHYHIHADNIREESETFHWESESTAKIKGHLLIKKGTYESVQTIGWCSSKSCVFKVRKFFCCCYPLFKCRIHPTIVFIVGQ